MVQIYVIKNEISKLKHYFIFLSTKDLKFYVID